MGVGLGAFEPTIGSSRNLIHARESKFEVTSVATGRNYCKLSTVVVETAKTHLKLNLSTIVDENTEMICLK